MNIPIETKPALWGMAGGAVALAIVGFSWGGWTTGGKAESTATMRANDAVVAALAPVCVDKFQRATMPRPISSRSRSTTPGHRATSSRRAAGPPCRE
jgi:hypothetical protein